MLFLLKPLFTRIYVKKYIIASLPKRKKIQFSIGSLWRNEEERRETGNKTPIKLYRKKNNNENKFYTPQSLGMSSLSEPFGGSGL